MAPMSETVQLRHHRNPSLFDHLHAVALGREGYESQNCATSLRCTRRWKTPTDVRWTANRELLHLRSICCCLHMLCRSAYAICGCFSLQQGTEQVCQMDDRRRTLASRLFSAKALCRWQDNIAHAGVPAVAHCQAANAVVRQPDCERR